MSTSAVGSSTSGTLGKTAASKNLNLGVSDFVNMMITQLQNQDPLQPTSSDQLMSQMSQIGQLQSTTQLQTTLQGLAQQTQVSAASALIGKQIMGTDANNNPVGGVVASVQVSSSGCSLQLDNGNSLDLSRVTAIGPAPAAATGGAAPAAGA